MPAPRNSRLCQIISLQCLRVPPTHPPSQVHCTMYCSPKNTEAASNAFLGHPLHLLPLEDDHLRRYIIFRVSGILETCPNHGSRFARTKVSIGLILVGWYHLCEYPPEVVNYIQTMVLLLGGIPDFISLKQYLLWELLLCISESFCWFEYCTSSRYYSAD